MNNYNNYSKKVIPTVGDIEVDDEEVFSTLKSDIGKVIDCENLNVRKEPDIDASVLGFIPVNSEVKIDHEQSTDDFYSICSASGLEGFCMKKYIAIS